MSPKNVEVLVYNEWIEIQTFEVFLFAAHILYGKENI